MSIQNQLSDGTSVADKMPVQLYDYQWQQKRRRNKGDSYYPLCSYQRILGNRTSDKTPSRANSKVSSNLV